MIILTFALLARASLSETLLISHIAKHNMHERVNNRKHPALSSATLLLSSITCFLPDTFHSKIPWQTHMGRVRILTSYGNNGQAFLSRGHAGAQEAGGRNPYVKTGLYSQST